MGKKNRKKKRKRKAKKSKAKRERAELLNAHPEVPQVEAWMYLTDLNVLREIRQQMLKDHRPDSCINAVNLLATIARQVGIEVTPMTVETHVSNAVIVEWMDQNPGAAMTNEEGVALNERGGKYIILGERGIPPEKPSKWAGHLVAVMRPPTDFLPTMVIDLSIDQANRPDHDINLKKPIVLKLTQEKLYWLDGGTLLGVDKDNVRCVYQAFPDDLSFQRAGGWTRTYDPNKFWGLLCTPSAI